ncbi:Outer membrane protein TolC [Chitinophaga rupis]|uniref:Outer membrane protein TolC n=1 Tax=Chitinophaga rupis TaxID=573321 RepID=A0A1H7MCM4_9BACT|nr:TolC family protein [Chitinophaga rupis]SEL08367.1 Outer membrane protein TolC [Chitinophaga rupis]
MQSERKLIILAGSLLLLMALTTTLRAQQAAPQSQGPLQLSAKQAVDYALANQTTIKNARLDELIQLAKNKEVSGLALPTITANGAYSYSPVLQKSQIDLHNFDPSAPEGTYQAVAFGLTHNMTGDVKLNQTLFDPSVLVALQARKTLEELVARNVQKSEVDVKVAVYKAYYNVLSANKALTILKGNIATLDKTLSDTRETYKNGLAEKLDVDRLTVQMANLSTEITKLRNLIEVGTAALKFQMGMPMAQAIELTDTLSTEAIAAQTVNVDGFNYDQRIEYQVLQSQKRANEYDLKRYKMKGLPTLSFNASAGSLRGSSQFDYFKNPTWYGYSTLGLNLSVPIFAGFQRKRQVDQAFLALKKTEQNVENLKLSIDLEQSQSASTFRNNLLTLQSQEQNMQLAQEVYTTTQIKYREGVGSSLEMSTAENDLLTAQKNYFDALYNTIVAKIDYMKAYGKL